MDGHSDIPLPYPSLSQYPSRSMLPQVPYTMLSSPAAGSGISMPLSVFSRPPSFRYSPPSETVANENMELPPYMMLNSSSSSASSGLKAQSELEVKFETLETQIDTLTAKLQLEKRERMVVDEECEQLKIRLLGEEEQARLRDEVSRVTEEVSQQIEEMSRLREEMSSLREDVSGYRRRESERMNADMLEQLNINQQFQENPQTNHKLK